MTGTCHSFHYKPPEGFDEMRCELESGHDGDHTHTVKRIGRTPSDFASGRSALVEYKWSMDPKHCSKSELRSYRPERTKTGPAG